MNNTNIIDEEDYKLRFPNNDKFDIGEMEDEVKDYYLRLYSLYMNLFTKYLIKNTSIKIYDTYLKDSELNFISIKNQDKDIYQKLSGENLSYFYVRNNLYLNRLTQEETKYLGNILISDIKEFDSDIENFIGNTYKKLIYEDINGSYNITTNFGPESPQFFAPVNSLVIGVRYDEFNDNSMSDEEWDNNYSKQSSLLESFINQLTSNIKTNLNDNIKVIKYDDFSIKKKDNFEVNHNNLS